MASALGVIRQTGLSAVIYRIVHRQQEAPQNTRVDVLKMYTVILCWCSACRAWPHYNTLRVTTHKQALCGFSVPLRGGDVAGSQVHNSNGAYTLGCVSSSTSVAIRRSWGQDSLKAGLSEERGAFNIMFCGRSMPAYYSATWVKELRRGSAWEAGAGGVSWVNTLYNLDLSGM